MNTLFANCAMLLMLGGCSWLPSGQDKDKADSGTADAPPQLEQCSLKARACQKTCLDMGSACSDCCQRNADACDRGDGYRFSSCPDAQ